LHPIDSKSGPKFTGIKETKDGQIQPYTLSWNPCTKFSSGGGCSDVLLCQTDSNSPQLKYPVGKEVDTFTESTDGMILVTYKEVDYGNYKRTGAIGLKCDESKTPGDLSQFTEKVLASGSGSQYTATFASKCVCEGGCPDAPGGNESEGSGGLSTGSILLIVFFPLVFVYFIAGVLYNKYHKGAESFPEMIPNHSFWSDFPFLVKDGCVFSFQCISGCCTSLCMKIKGDSYAKI